MRPLGLSAFVRCKNEEEYIVASLLSVYRVFDELVVVLNNSTDQTRDLVSDLMADHPKIKLIEYSSECSPIGPGYIDRVRQTPSASLALYYNWCVEQTSFSHVCKWDGDMIATPVFEQVRNRLKLADTISFDGYDVIGEKSTDLEARIFRYDPLRAQYRDWDLYEVLHHDYQRNDLVREKCYLHMKLAKREWVHRSWSNPNDLATRSVPETGGQKKGARHLIWHVMRRLRSITRAT
jgi:glycosyltransferase involved in cell wall biosynthesis